MLPQEENVKVTGEAELTSDGALRGKIYNGSGWTIEEIVIQIVAKEKNGSVKWHREFNTLLETTPPLEIQRFRLPLYEDIASFEWNIVEIWGHKGFE